MNKILENLAKNNYYINDIVIIEYWYNNMVTPVKIVEKQGKNYIISHNIEQSKIRNAPNEKIGNTDIISIYR